MEEDTCRYGEKERKQKPKIDSRRRTENVREDTIVLVGIEGVHSLRLGSLIQPNPQPRYQAEVYGSLALRVATFSNCSAMQSLKNPLPCEYACKIRDAEATLLGRPGSYSPDLRTISLAMKIECGYYTTAAWSTFGTLYYIEAIFGVLKLAEDDPLHDDLSSCNPSPPEARSFSDRVYHLTGGHLEWSSPEATIFPPQDSCPCESYIIRRKLPEEGLPTISFTSCYLFSEFIDIYDIRKYGAYCRGSGCWSQYMCHCPGHVISPPVYHPKFLFNPWDKSE